MQGLAFPFTLLHMWLIPVSKWFTQIHHSCVAFGFMYLLLLPVFIWVFFPCRLFTSLIIILHGFFSPGLLRASTDLKYLLQVIVGFGPQLYLFTCWVPFFLIHVLYHPLRCIYHQFSVDSTRPQLCVHKLVWFIDADMYANCTIWCTYDFDRGCTNLACYNTIEIFFKGVRPECLPGPQEKKWLSLYVEAFTVCWQLVVLQHQMNQTSLCTHSCSLVESTENWW